MGIQPVHLPLQLFRVVPVVVPLAEGDVFAPRRREEYRVIDIDAPGIEIFLLIEGPDDVRMLCRVLPQNVRRRIRRGVIADENLVGEIRFLRKEAVQRRAQIGSL